MKYTLPTQSQRVGACVGHYRLGLDTISACWALLARDWVCVGGLDQLRPLCGGILALLLCSYFYQVQDKIIIMFHNHAPYLYPKPHLVYIQSWDIIKQGK